LQSVTVDFDNGMTAIIGPKRGKQILWKTFAGLSGKKQVFCAVQLWKRNLQRTKDRKALGYAEFPSQSRIQKESFLRNTLKSKSAGAVSGMEQAITC
jgi:hypothetical protein